MRKGQRWKQWTILFLAGTAGFGLARGIRSFNQPSLVSAPPIEQRTSLSLTRDANTSTRAFTGALQVQGSDQISELLEALQLAHKNEALRQLARRLLADPTNASSESLWSLLLARWSEIDAKEMMSFVDGLQGHTSIEKLKSLAFEAWGAVDPSGAYEAVRSRSESLRWAALRGMAAADSEQAVAFALKMPNAQFALSDLVKNTVLPEETLSHLLTRSIYDGSREPIQRQMVAQLAKSDPAGAVQAASEAGRTWRDPIAHAIAEIAQHNVPAAIEQLEALPDSRQRALSSLSLTRTWAAQDSVAALEWVRESLSDQIRQAALLEIAAIAGGQDPLTGLALVEEAGWHDVGNFHDIVNQFESGEVRAQSYKQLHSIEVAQSLVRQLSMSDPEAARKFVSHADASVRDMLARAADLNSTQP